MIPLQLELKNFLSYRDPAVLAFDGVHVACVSGPNGAGKSSLLDAITWALFGRSRSKSDDDLVNRIAALEGKAAEVKFTFTLEKSVYRVMRRKKPRQITSLELQIAVSGNGSSAAERRWKSLSEGGVRDTQAAIERLLRMNYDTFINASFLLQGKADEFTTKTPNRRKEVLADLLGVSLWDRYKETAAARRKEEEGRLLLLEGQLGEIKQELDEEQERKAALEAAQAEYTAVGQRLADKETLLEQLRRTEAAVQQQREMIGNLANNLDRARRNLDDLQQTQQQRQQERDEHQAILAEADKIAAEYQTWQKAEAALQAWQDKADRYNRWQQAKRPHELAVAQARSRLQQQQQELEAQAERVAAAVAERETVAQRLAQSRARLQEVTADLSQVAEQEEAWHEARAELQRLQGERRLQAQELSRLQAQARRVQAMAEEKAAVDRNAEEAKAAVADLTAEVAAVNERHQRHAAARAELDTLRVEQERLRQQMNKARERIDSLQAETGSECPLCGQSLSQEHRQTVLAEVEAEGKVLGDRYRANKTQIETLTVEVTELEKRLQQSGRLERDLQAQQQRLAKAEARLAEIEGAVAEWEAEGQEQLAALQATLADESAVADQKQRVQALATAVQEKSKLEKEREAQQRQVSTAEARLAEIDRAQREWEEEGQAALTAVKQKLAQGEYASEAQAALADLEAQIADLDYDSDAHEAARRERQALAEAPARHQALKQAEAAVKPLEDTLADLDRQIAEQEEHVQTLERQQELAQVQLQNLTADGDDLHAVEDEVFRLREQEIAANRRVGAAQQRLAVLDEQRRKQKELRAQRTELRQRIQRLKLLEKACGRNGVQALLIEQALPDIEERANELLERLTRGDMRVSFETQKQLKSRDALAETLDIRIVDGAGERPYDNYSGGEQFRVNFAIRLALSQVLAKRAGARLQSLVIDEGFGSQDPNGRQRLIEAINTIQDDFARILVITHIDELRDAFPTRIEVRKEATGSQISVT